MILPILNPQRIQAATVFTVKTGSNRAKLHHIHLVLDSTTSSKSAQMLDGWYCRSIANMQANEAASGGANAPQQGRDCDYSSDTSSDVEAEPNYKAQYMALKKKLKYLIYENECFQDALRSSQKRLLKVSRDRSFLLDRLLQYEKPESTTSESEETETSDDTEYRIETVKRKKIETQSGHHNISTPVPPKGQSTVKRKRAVMPKKTHSNAVYPHQTMSGFTSKAAAGLGVSGAGDGHMTPEEVERHLRSRHSYLELLPERAPPTVPTEMFSNDPSLDSESNDVLENSPNVEEWFD
ncbi:INO80 complex subunit E [Eumeta japonica]|uniref:INO80 complex subunit E n=1 Tax=Eumeta variegata TaxID=151549 RepID=A0A4C1UA32_EUMVA|nr:INO80 complex subunit E [Eumeta japonica]